ncbi:MAG: YebC/PmpR family DNA-binding transcriptional regulator [Patescibacteria group bacterium]
MSGHSKWSTIKRKKGINDLTRAKLFTKLLFQISNAVKSGHLDAGNLGSGGGDPNNNYTLKLAIKKAREANIPISTIENVIKKASLVESNNATEDIEYEVYIPVDNGGSRLNVELLVDCQISRGLDPGALDPKGLSSSKNRLVAEMREAVARNGGKMLSQGSISWNFVPLSLITIKINRGDNQLKKANNKLNLGGEKGKDIIDVSSFEEELLSIDGVYDYEYDKDVGIDSERDSEFRVYTTLDNTNMVKDAILDKGYLIDNIENVKVAKNKLKIDDFDISVIDKIESFVDAIESVEGVVNTYLNI